MDTAIDPLTPCFFIFDIFGTGRRFHFALNTPKECLLQSPDQP